MRTPVTKMKLLTNLHLSRNLQQIGSRPFTYAKCLPFDGYRGLHCAHTAGDAVQLLRIPHAQITSNRKNFGYGVCHYSQTVNSWVKCHAVDIFESAIDAVYPEKMVKRVLNCQQDKLLIKGIQYPLEKNVYIAAFGKAVLGMVAAAEAVVHPHVVTGIASVPLKIQETFRNAGRVDLLLPPTSVVKVVEGSPNNIPDSNAHQAAMDIYRMAQSLSHKDILLVLMSGGGSALLPAPIPPITLEEMAETTRVMSRGGATIQQMNTVRKHLELLKGGGLAQAAAPAKVVSLILSDVIGDPLDLIASGPTVPDSSTPQQCLDLCDMLDITYQLPDSVFKLLKKQAVEVDARNWRSGGLPESDVAKAIAGPKPLFDCHNSQNVVIGSNRIAIDGCVKQAEQLGYIPYVLSLEFDGEAARAGKMLARLARFICESLMNKGTGDAPGSLIEAELKLVGSGLHKTKVNDILRVVASSHNSGKPICILSGGETVVNVKGKGKGGRSQELALAAALEMGRCWEKNPSLKKFEVQLLSGGTDGQDGPTDAAGAVVDATLAARAREQGFKVSSYLDNNDAYTFFSQFNGGSNHIMTGLTGTNVMDVEILLIHHNSAIEQL